MSMQWPCLCCFSPTAPRPHHFSSPPPLSLPPTRLRSPESKCHFMALPLSSCRYLVIDPFLTSHCWATHNPLHYSAYCAHTHTHTQPRAEGGSAGTEQRGTPRHKCQIIFQLNLNLPPCTAAAIYQSRHSFKYTRAACTTTSLALIKHAHLYDMDADRDHLPMHVEAKTERHCAVNNIHQIRI